MGKFSTEGAFYLHIIAFSFLLIIFTVLKNFNFEEFKNSPDLTLSQVKFIYLFLFIGIISIFLLFVRGFFVKTPQEYTRAGFAMLFIVIGLLLIIGMLIHEEMLGNEQVIGPYESVGILIGSMLTFMGSLAYISLKFPDEIMMKYFKQAVKEEIRKRAAEEQQWRAWNAKQKQQQRKVQAVKKPKVKKPQSKKTRKTKIKVPDVQTAKMSPPGDIAVVKCARCKRSLKVTSPERPITIKCPYCEAIGVIKE